MFFSRDTPCATNQALNKLIYDFGIIYCVSHFGVMLCRIELTEICEKRITASGARSAGKPQANRQSAVAFRADEIELCLRTFKSRHKIIRCVLDSYTKHMTLRWEFSGLFH